MRTYLSTLDGQYPSYTILIQPRDRFPTWAAVSANFQHCRVSKAAEISLSKFERTRTWSKNYRDWQSGNDVQPSGVNGVVWFSPEISHM